MPGVTESTTNGVTASNINGVKASSMNGVKVSNMNGVKPSIVDGFTGSNSTRRSQLKMAEALARSLETPEEKICRTFWFDLYKFSAIKVGIDVGLFNFMVENSGKPLSVEELGQVSGVETRLLSRFLKVLAADGFVNEVDVGKYVANGVTKVMSDYNFQGLITEQFEIGLPIAAVMPSYLKKENYKEPTSKDRTVFRHSKNTDKTTFEWFADPANARDLSNNTRHMTAKNMMTRRWFETVNAYDVLGEISGPNSPVFVDIGGSNGSEATAMLRAYPNLNGSIIVQDLAGPIEDSKSKLPEGIVGQVYNFFTPQPIIGAKNYFLHMVLHDWPDEQCREILTNQKGALVKGYSKILINEIVVPDRDAGWYEMGVDMIMMTCLSATERTESEWRRLVESAGLCVTQILDCDGEGEKIIVVELP